MTSKVVKISELQEIFSEKVLQQSSDIEHIHAQTVSTTENMKVSLSLLLSVILLILLSLLLYVIRNTLYVIRYSLYVIRYTLYIIRYTLYVIDNHYTLSLYVIVIRYRYTLS